MILPFALTITKKAGRCGKGKGLILIKETGLLPRWHSEAPLKLALQRKPSSLCDVAFFLVTGRNEFRPLQ